MPYGGGVGVDTPDVGVDELLVVSAVDGVVERGPVGADFDAGGAGERPVVHERETAAGFDAVAEPLLLTPGLDVVAVGVPDRDADGAAFGGAFGEEFVQPRVRLVEEDGRVDEDVDPLPGLGHQVGERRDGDVGPLLVERHQLRADGAGGAGLAERRPECMHVFSQGLGRLEGGGTTRDTPEVHPALDRLGVDLDFMGEGGVRPASGRHDGS